MRDLVTLSTLHFFGWNAMPHLVSHSASILRSSWSASQSEMPLICLHTMQSSAKSLEFEVILSGRSLMNMRKSIGPSTDPWGTSLATGTLSDELPSTTTLWVRPDRKRCNLAMYGASDSKVFKFPQETLVWNSIEGFGEIQDQHVCLDPLVQWWTQIMAQGH